MFLPKRAEELPPLESESEDETDHDPWVNFAYFSIENLSIKFLIIRLNTNILDASFIEDLNDFENDKNILNSPAKSDALLQACDSIEKGLKNVSVQHVSTHNEIPPFTRGKRTLSASSRQLNFANNVIHATPSSTAAPIIRRPSVSTIKRGKSFNSLKLTDVLEDPIIQCESTDVKSRSLELAVNENHIDGTENNRTTKSEGLHTYQKPNDILETPMRKSNDNFATPLVKFQMPTVTRLLTTQKSRESIEKEFRSQKILFTTPLSISRPPHNNMLANNSLSLPFDDVLALNKDESVEIKPPPVMESVQKLEKQSSFQSITINDVKYEIHSKLGAGGSSSVYLATNTETCIECAVKAVHLQGERSVIEGYINETRLLAKLQGNVNVIRLYDYMHLPNESVLYMVMEKGESDLNKILMNHTDLLPLYELLAYWHQMLLSVDYIHKHGK